MHKHLDQIRNLNYKTKLCLLLYVLLMHNFIFELRKLHMMKITPIEVGRKALTVFLLINIQFEKKYFYVSFVNIKYLVNC